MPRRDLQLSRAEIRTGAAFVAGASAPAPRSGCGAARTAGLRAVRPARLARLAARRMPQPLAQPRREVTLRERAFGTTDDGGIGGRGDLGLYGHAFARPCDVGYDSGPAMRGAGG